MRQLFHELGKLAKNSFGAGQGLGWGKSQAIEAFLVQDRLLTYWFEGDFEPSYSKAKGIGIRNEPQKPLTKLSGAKLGQDFVPAQGLGAANEHKYAQKKLRDGLQG